MATSTQYEAFRENWRPTQGKLDQAVELIVATAKPSRIFVFGSWARGEDSVDSDLDIAVFLSDSMAPVGGEIEDSLLEVLDDLPVSIDLVVALESAAKASAKSVNSIFFKIEHEGKLVYEHSPAIEGRSTAA